MNTQLTIYSATANSNTVLTISELTSTADKVNALDKGWGSDPMQDDPGIEPSDEDAVEELESDDSALSQMQTDQVALAKAFASKVYFVSIILNTYNGFFIVPSMDPSDRQIWCLSQPSKAHQTKSPGSL